jgi:8-oxo-dGTP pyrophosphatase MutT (NUDIX family)
MIASRTRNVVARPISYAGPVELPVPVRRLIYRTGYRALKLVWRVRRPSLHGVKCVITDGDMLLLVRHTYGRACWDLPGGRIERAEPPVEAAAREMREELGLRDADWVSAGELELMTDHRHDTIHVFRAELHAQAVMIDRGELAAARWFPRAELPVDLSPHLTLILAQADGRGG